MANTIAKRKAYAAVIDEVYKKASLTAVLDGPADLVRAGANAGEILIPKISMDPLANYDRSTGYAAGSVTWEYETRSCGYDRGRIFSVDSVDNEETAGGVFGNLAGEFVRTQVVPELDAYRFGAYATKATAGTTGTIATGAAAVAAISTAKAAIMEAEADPATCYLYLTPTIKTLIDDLDTTKSKAALQGWAGVITVPQSRFFKTVTLTAAGGWTGAQAINFLIVPKEAVIQFQKHTVPKIITPEQNQDADAYKYAYRTVGIADVKDNKKGAIYAHTVAAG